MTEQMKIIEALCNEFGPSGAEWRVADKIFSAGKSLCREYRRDTMGNLIFRVGAGQEENRIKIMVCAHTDEVGFMITEVREDGLLCFESVGGIDESVLSARRVVVEAKDKSLIHGVISSKAVHHKSREERARVPKADSLYIDIGASDRESAERYVEIGSFASFAPNFSVGGEGDGFFFGKALDDRLGCAAALEIMSSLSENPLAEGSCADIYFCFTTREEIGRSGARCAAYSLSPDIAIVLESTAVADIAGVDEHRRVAALGDGVSVSIMDRGTIYDKELFERAMRLSREKSISAQIKKYVSGGNDASSVHRTRAGVRTLALSVPTRYLHSPCAVASIADFSSQAALAEALIRDLALLGNREEI